MLGLDARRVRKLSYPADSRGIFSLRMRANATRRERRAGPVLAMDCGVTPPEDTRRMLRVMLVDDSHEEVSPLKEGLVCAGYDVVVVSAHGLALAERVTEFAPDVIIIDTESPSRDVLEHVAAVSAHASAADRAVHR